ncbi:hypothetical protein [Desulfosporosinus meridiei]|uniref:Uncharacterized protein n=1 Tax=Desulfosporosinus meridiei (strain ATCC BAA-275 / DSM 13257 / KCTC 12902 / NCIMB 13706 / S10) TaxID=768704 RepID=J7IPT7_DESMD|nr:hypothetical protein [Desulfosporosinus meridiei]AFQ43837.1 hypothetical protein Desmer_1879 [Desulfosporosinus meridiei DSM 13257]
MNLKMKKILAGAFGLGLIILLLLFVNSFVGNPVSNALAKKAAQQYIDTKYSDLNLKIERSNYNFKFGSYFVFVKSGTSEDTAFSIYVDSYGNVIRDDYEYEVANNFTTFRRLDEELREIAKEMIGGELDYDFDHIALPFVKEGDLSKLERDMTLDIHNPPLPLTIDVTLFSQDVSFSKIAEVAKALEAVLHERDIPVREYSIRILPLSDKPQSENQAVSWVNSLSVSYFPSERMGEANLPQVMEQFETGRVAEVNAKDKK